MTGRPTTDRYAAPTITPSRRERGVIAGELAAGHGGLVSRAQLRNAGIDRHAIRTEVAAGRWAVAGRHTVVVLAAPQTGAGRWWQALWESGTGAMLDGAAALQASGLSGYRPGAIDVTVPWSTTRWSAVEGVRVHRRRAVPLGPSTGVPRVCVESAVIHAAQWARTDRQAALLVCLTVQQRLVATDRLLGAWRGIRRSPRRRVLDLVFSDVCDGAHSLGELDFARLCRRHGLPPPTRQSVRELATGRVYLDAQWVSVGLTVEIDGGHHALGLNPVDDALRHNEIALERALVLRIPVLGLRLLPGEFMSQVARAHALARRPAA